MTSAAAPLEGLATCLRLHAHLVRASSVLRFDREQAGRLLAMARAATERPRMPLEPRVARELRGLLDEAAGACAKGDIPSAESSTALAEALCLAGMVRNAALTPPPGEREP